MPNFIPFDKDTACQIINIVNSRLTDTVEENDYAYIKVFSEMVDAMAHGKTSCVVHDYMYSKETKKDVQEILEHLGYTIEPYSGHLQADAMFRVIWRKPNKIKPVYDIPNIRFDGRVDGVTYIDQVVGPVKPKELTITQIESLLGYKIKIINDKESK